MYADDAVLLRSDKTWDGLKIKSEAEMHRVESWVTANKLTINYSKTNFVLFSNKIYKINCAFKHVMKILSLTKKC